MAIQQDAIRVSCQVTAVAVVTGIDVSSTVSDGFQAQKRGSWIWGTERAEGVLASAISIDERKEWTCKFCSESNGRDGVAGAATMTSRQGCVGSTGRRLPQGQDNGWSTGSSTSSGKEERRNKSLEAKKKELRARLETLEKRKVKQSNEGKGFHQGESGLEEEWGCGDGPRG